MVGLHYFSLLFSLLTKYILFIFSPPFSIYFVFNSAKHTLNSYENIRGCLVFFFHYSLFLTQFSSLITHHLSLKIPQFPIPIGLAHFTQLFITQFFYFFVGPTLEHNVKPQLAYPCNIYSSQSFSPHIFPLQPTYSPRALNKPNEAVDTIITI